MLNIRKLTVIAIVLYFLLNAPVFQFKTDFGGISRYSLLDNIKMDISEKQFTIPYSIMYDLAYLNK